MREGDPRAAPADAGEQGVKTLAALGILSGGAAVLCFVFYVGFTSWAYGQSIERTECYRTAKQVCDCSQPGTVEQFARWLTMLGYAHPELLSDPSCS